MGIDDRNVINLTAHNLFLKVIHYDFKSVIGIVVHPFYCKTNLKKLNIKHISLLLIKRIESYIFN